MPRHIFWKSQRLSDIIILFCLPLLIYLCIKDADLSGDFRLISNRNIFTSLDRYPSSSQSVGYSFKNENKNTTIYDTSLGLLNTQTLLNTANQFLNNTKKSNQDLVIFTSIFRAGFSSLRYYFKSLKQLNKFVMIASSAAEKEIIDIPMKEKQKSVANKVLSVNETAIIFNSFAFINFTQFGFQQPIYVSLIRDPVERAISSYYFIRAPYQVVEKKSLFPELELPSRTFLKKSIESCLVNHKDNECNYIENQERYGHTIQFFCGHDHFCKLFGNKDALQKAKEVVEKHFSVVGVLENLEKTAVVLERFIPRFFKGLSQIINQDNTSQNKEESNKNIYKPSVASWARNLLRKKLTTEYDFYNFLVARLNRQYESVINDKS